MPNPVDEFRRAVEGSVCRELVAQAHGYRGSLVAPVTVLYFAFGARRWAHFGIDCGDFHWRETAAVEPIPGGGSGHAYPLVDLAASIPVVGRHANSVTLYCQHRGAVLQGAPQLNFMR